MGDQYRALCIDLVEAAALATGRRAGATWEQRLPAHRLAVEAVAGELGRRAG